MVDGRYNLTQAADADLERLYEWGIDRFGVNAADEYHEGLIARLGQIADTPQLWQEVDHIRAGYRRSVYVAAGQDPARNSGPGFGLPNDLLSMPKEFPALTIAF